MNIFQNITNLDYLFNFYPSTDFQYAPYVFVFVIALFASTYIFDLYVKKVASSDKYLYKALKGNMGMYRWAFTSTALIMTISRLEGISLFNMRIWWIVYLIIFIVYTYFKIKNINKNYKSRIKNKERFSAT